MGGELESRFAEMETGRGIGTRFKGFQENARVPERGTRAIAERPVRSGRKGMTFATLGHGAVVSDGRLAVVAERDGGEGDAGGGGGDERGAGTEGERSGSDQGDGEKKGGEF